jgi:hypothetical protein
MLEIAQGLVFRIVEKKKKKKIKSDSNKNASLET